MSDSESISTAPRTFDVTATLTIRHGGLAIAVAACGSQAELARRLGVRSVDVSSWCLMKACPPEKPNRFWSEERWNKLEADLFSLTNQTMDELFPRELRMHCKYAKEPLKLERRITFERERLADLAAMATERLTLPSPADMVIDKMNTEGLQSVIEDVLCTLPRRERQILEMRFGLGEFDHSYGYEEIGRVFRVTHLRIHQLEQAAIRKLQQPSRTMTLVPYLD